MKLDFTYNEYQIYYSPYVEHGHFYTLEGIRIFAAYDITTDNIIKYIDKLIERKKLATIKNDMENI